jgi:chloride channel 7
MLSGDQDLPDGIGMARLAWTRLPTADGSAAASASTSAPQDELFVGAVESLDYEVIENYAYREEQVPTNAPRFAVLPCPTTPARGFDGLSVCARLGELLVCVLGALQAQRSKFWVPYYIMLKWFFALLIGVGECLLHDLFPRTVPFS